MKNYFKNKKILVLLVLIPVLCLVLLTPEFKYYSSKKIGRSKIKNKFLEQYLVSNKRYLINSCNDENTSVAYYNKIYNETINLIFDMNKKNYISKKDRSSLFSFIKNSEINKFINAVKNINLLIVDVNSLADYNYLLALSNELSFNSSETERYYKVAVETNKFNSKYRLRLAKFYKKNCEYDEAINILLETASLAASTEINSSLYNIYIMLGDLYLIKRDYENALVYYTNSLVNLDYRNKTKHKVEVLTKLGDIMSTRGEYFEAINYYKYAMSLKKLTKNENTVLSIKLAANYYFYGNYDNCLKFAKNALKNAKKINNSLYYSNAQYYICLSYEYLGKSSNETKSICNDAIKEADKYRMKVQNTDSYINLAELLDYSNYVKNSNLALDYLEQALSRNYNKNVYKKVNILEKIASIKAYNGDKNSKIEAEKIYKDLEEYYTKYGIAVGCCNNVINGFLKEQAGSFDAPEVEYLKGEQNLKNRKAQLITLYSYLSDFYKNKKDYKLALFYAKKSLDLSKQVYKFDHHYIKYGQGRFDSLKSIIDKDSGIWVYNINQKR